MKKRSITLIVAINLSLLFIVGAVWIFLLRPNNKSTTSPPSHEDDREPVTPPPLNLEDDTDIVPDLPQSDDSPNEDKVAPYPGDAKE